MINKMLSIFGIKLVRIKQEEIPEEAKNTYNNNYKKLLAISKERGLKVIRDFRYEFGQHPQDHRDIQCQFAAQCINELNPSNILDVGSYRLFILGLLSNFKVTTIDIRERKSQSVNERVFTCDATDLPLVDNSFDLVLSLHTLEHIGLGRYSDKFNLDADKIAFNEMLRVLKPQGHIIFTTMLNNDKHTIVFNAHRIYTYEILHSFCKDLICIKEKFWSYKKRDWCALEEVTGISQEYDIYCGCWRKEI